MGTKNHTGGLSRTKVAIVGGCGHVGLPLGVKFALAGADTKLVDVDAKAIQTVNSGRFPFLELGGDAQLQDALKMRFEATNDPKACTGCLLYTSSLRSAAKSLNASADRYRSLERRTKPPTFLQKKK